MCICEGMGPTHLCMYMYVCIEPECVSGAGTAQLVERPTEKPGAILTRVRGPGPARDFSPRVSFQCRLSYGVRTAPVCINIVSTLKVPNTGSHIIVWTHKNVHTGRNG